MPIGHFSFHGSTSFIPPPFLNSFLKNYKFKLNIKIFRTAHWAVQNFYEVQTRRPDSSQICAHLQRLLWRNYFALFGIIISLKKPISR
jgi:hypothetical protein